MITLFFDYEEPRYFRARSENIYPITNFLFEPAEMIVSDEDTQLTADLVTISGETYRVTFMTTDFANQQKFKNLLNKNTIALSYFGSDGDLELLKVIFRKWSGFAKQASRLWESMSTAEERFLFPRTVIRAGGTVVDDIVQLEKYRSIHSSILSCDPIAKDKFIGQQMADELQLEPAKSVSILAWAAGCFIKRHLRKEGVKYPHLFLVGEPEAGNPQHWSWCCCQYSQARRLWRLRKLQLLR